jgi:hypothetical protein
MAEHLNGADAFDFARMILGRGEAGMVRLDRGQAMNIREPQQLNPADASKLPGRPGCNWFFALPGSRYRLAGVRTNTAAPGASPNPLSCKHWAAGSAGSTRSRSKALQDQHRYQTWNVLFHRLRRARLPLFLSHDRGLYGVARPLAMISYAFQTAEVLQGARRLPDEDDVNVIHLSGWCGKPRSILSSILGHRIGMPVFFLLAVLPKRLGPLPQPR